MPLARDFSMSGRQAQHESRLLCSQLHLAIIQAFLLASKNEENPQDEMELEPGEVMDESDSRHLIKASDLKELSQDMIKLIDNSRALELNKAIIDQQVQLSVDRFAQTLQVAMATSCLSATKGNQYVCGDEKKNNKNDHGWTSAAFVATKLGRQTPVTAPTFVAFASRLPPYFNQNQCIQRYAPTLQRVRVNFIQLRCEGECDFAKAWHIKISLKNL